MSAPFRIRPARPHDLDVLHRFIVEPAEAEQFPGEVTARPGDLTRALFGKDAVAEAVLNSRSPRRPHDHRRRCPDPVVTLSVPFTDRLSGRWDLSRRVEQPDPLAVAVDGVGETQQALGVSKAF